MNSSSRAPALPQGLGPGRDCFGGGVASGAEAGLLTARIALQESSVSASALCHLGLSVVLGIFAARSSVILQQEPWTEEPGGSLCLSTLGAN